LIPEQYKGCKLPHPSLQLKNFPQVSEMKFKKSSEKTDLVKPIIAELPFQVDSSSSDSETPGVYNPELQQTTSEKPSKRRDYSLDRVSESIWPLFGKSKSDTQRGD
jgi:hypothetical protein